MFMLKSDMWFLEKICLKKRRDLTVSLPEDVYFKCFSHGGLFKSHLDGR